MVDLNKQDLINKALTDPSFRKLLETQPTKALGVTTMTPENTSLVKSVLDQVKAVNTKISGVADELLCANGGPCGIAAPADRALKKGGRSV